MSPARRAPRRLLPAACRRHRRGRRGPGPAARPRRHGGSSGRAGAGRARCAPAARPAPQLPQVSLAGLRWSGYHGVELPSSPAAGPRDTSGGLASGFADTPLGALLAALNIAVRANAQWGPGVYGPTIRDQVTGPDAAALLAGCQADYAQASQAAHITDGAPLGNAYVSEEAFRWVAYSPAGRDRGPGQRRAGQPGRHGAGDHPRRGRLVRRRLAGGRPARRRLGQRRRRAVLAVRLHRLSRSGVSADVMSGTARPGLRGRQG